MEQPGMIQALVNALRNKAGLGVQKTPGPSTDVAGDYRRYLEEAALRGEQPMNLRDWQNIQSQTPVSILR